jgi:curli biogenesis system outer membrane secretion channel CsgG
MKRDILLLVILTFFLSLGSGSLYAQEKPSLGVLRFTNNVAGIEWWNSQVADELADLLTAELINPRAFRVLERNEIGAVLSEQDLSASGRVDKNTLVKMKQIEGAKFLIAGTISAFEKSGAKGGKIRFKGISLGLNKSKTYIAVDVKIIDTETGEIVDARTIEANAKSKAIAAGLNLQNFSVAGGQAKKTPTGKAIRACIMYISDYLACSMIHGMDAPCMKKWDKMEAQRRERTRKTLSFE